MTSHLEAREIEEKLWSPRVVLMHICDVCTMSDDVAVHSVSGLQMAYQESDIPPQSNKIALSNSHLLRRGRSKPVHPCFHLPTNGLIQHPCLVIVYVSMLVALSSGQLR